MLGQRRANAHTLGGTLRRGGPWGARGARASRALADGRALRARTGGRLRRRQGRGAKGPRGALGFFQRLAEWKGIQRGNALEIVFFRQLFCKGFSKSEKLPAIL